MAGILNHDLHDPLRLVGGRDPRGYWQLVAEGTAMIVCGFAQTAEIFREHSHGMERLDTGRIVAVRRHMMGGHDAEHREHKRGAERKHHPAKTMDHGC
ncbi:hypothetical protein P775_26210 [Puniceibacterium antarcticum]|uniref:Uncharacterized protein n=1 Tax=Puniceibacterium antarcticum TaxID=1206336 RepID=A0A2G8R042_9RHOB|nr:hypothetical protein P775_26210 [Puniceibacterium antarcticum]